MTSSVGAVEADAHVRLRRQRLLQAHLAQLPTDERPWSSDGRSRWLYVGRLFRVDNGQLTAEQRARVLIDRQLTDAGWSVQNRSQLNLFTTQGVAVREVIMAAGHGRADYLLYVDQRVVGAIEAKPEGTTLSGVEWQSAMYAEGLPPQVRLKALTKDGRLPFVFEASGSETHFTNGFDPVPRARRIFNVPRPETLARVMRDAGAAPRWRAPARPTPL
jgi:type I restriction enzyme R subunit